MLWRAYTVSSALVAHGRGRGSCTRRLGARLHGVAHYQQRPATHGNRTKTTKGIPLPQGLFGTSAQDHLQLVGSAGPLTNRLRIHLVDDNPSLTFDATSAASSDDLAG